MSSLRVVLVTRRYWPLTGGRESLMMNLADEFRQQGHRVQILTAQWEPHWPAEIIVRDVPVTRLRQSAVPGWGTFQYIRALGQWLRGHKESYDIVYVASLRYDAFAALGALQYAKQPVVLRTDVSGVAGDCQWHQRARLGARIRHRCLSANAFITPNQAIRDELKRASFATNRLHLIPTGIEIPDAVTPETRQAARLSLGEVNHDLTTKPETPVVVAVSRLQQTSGLFALVRAWPNVMTRLPNARLWIVGDGPDREALYELILDLELRGRVLLPGTFDEMIEVLYAAETCVVPNSDETGAIPLLQAMAATIPVVAVDTPANQNLIRHEEHGLLTPSGDPNALADAIIRQLDKKILAKHYASAARDRVVSQFSISQSASQHLDLFESLLKKN